MPHTPNAYAVLAAACLIGCALAFSQESEPEPPLPQVVVTSMKDPYKTAYRNIRKALTAQHDNPQLAPQARVRWMLFAKDGAPVTVPLPITIAGTNGQVPVVQDGDGVFELPATVPDLGDDVELRIGAKRSEVALVPLVETGGIDASSRRLGDLRLECEMTWRLEYDDIPFALKAAMKLMGSPCGSKNFGVPFHVRRKLESATIARDGQPLRLKLGWRSMAFFAPLHDGALGNDTLITLAYRRQDP
jgi:hypothetical protein